MTPAAILALAQAAATIFNTVAALRSTADATTQAQIDAALATAKVQFTTDATTAEADLAAAGG